MSDSFDGKLPVGMANREYWLNTHSVGRDSDKSQDLLSGGLQLNPTLLVQNNSNYSSTVMSFDAAAQIEYIPRWLYDGDVGYGIGFNASWENRIVEDPLFDNFSEVNIGAGIYIFPFSLSANNFLKISIGLGAGTVSGEKMHMPEYKLIFNDDNDIWSSFNFWTQAKIEFSNREYGLGVELFALAEKSIYGEHIRTSSSDEDKEGEFDAATDYDTMSIYIGGRVYWAPFAYCDSLLEEVRLFANILYTQSESIYLNYQNRGVLDEKFSYYGFGAGIAWKFDFGY